MWSRAPFPSRTRGGVTLALAILFLTAPRFCAAEDEAGTGGKPPAAEEAATTLPAEPAPASTEARLTEVWRVPLGSPLAGSFLVLGSVVVASTTEGRVRSLAASDGKTVWEADLAEPLDFGGAASGEQIIQGTSRGRLVSLNPGNGSTLWSVDLLDGIRHPPACDPGQIVVPLAGGELVSLDSAGAERWRVRLKGAATATPSYCGGAVIAGTESGTVESYDRATGRRLWITEMGSAVRSPILCHRGKLYFGTADYRFNALRADGKRRWRTNVGGDVTAAPIGRDRRVTFLCYDDTLYVLKARSGHLILKSRLSHRLVEDALDLGDRIYLSPATSARLLSLSLPDLGRLAEYKLDLDGEWFTTPPVSSAGLILVGYGRTEGRILALREEAAKPAPSP